MKQVFTAAETSSGDAPVITAVQSLAGHPRLITWDDQPRRGEL